jgi:phospholipid-translocating ATPase
MVFRRASVGGVIYAGDETEEDQTSRSVKELETAPSSASTQATMTTSVRPLDAVGIKLSGGVLQRFISPELTNELNAVAANPDTPDRQRLEMFWTVLALCHTVLAGVDPITQELEYKAQSPDEAALVQAAADIGFEFRGRDKDILYLRTPFASEPLQFRLLNILDFTSARKRMSVLLRALSPDGKDEGPIMIFTKGADNVVFERLRSGDDGLKRATEAHLDEFASLGLRTLTLAYRLVSDDEYARWVREYQEASATLEDREDKVEAVSSSIEHGFKLLGATAIEDRLQDGVPETIADLKRAGIKVWVLTGDKLETAIAIGYSTNLITPESNVIVIRGRSALAGDEPDESRTIYAQMLRAADEYFPEAGILDDPAVDSDVLTRARRRLSRRLSSDVRDLVGHDNGSRGGGHVLVIDGRALEDALGNARHRHLLLRLGVLCQAVVCCRVSPKQKALVVRLVKDGIPGTMTLAIGDGANDVSMIQAADVGVGISGEEGLQAVNSSDYAIAQFRFLKRLLLVHGHWSYYRNSNMCVNPCFSWLSGGADELGVQDQQLLLQEHHLYRRLVVVPDLLWLVIGIVRSPSSIRAWSCANQYQQPLRIHLPPLLELILDACARRRYRRIRPAHRRPRTDENSGAVPVWPRAALVQQQALRDLHARRRSAVRDRVFHRALPVQHHNYALGRLRGLPV